MKNASYMIAFASAQNNVGIDPATIATYAVKSIKCDNLEPKDEFALFNRRNSDPFVHVVAAPADADLDVKDPWNWRFGGGGGPSDGGPWWAYNTCYYDDVVNAMWTMDNTYEAVISLGREKCIGTKTWMKWRSIPKTYKLYVSVWDDDGEGSFDLLLQKQIDLTGLDTGDHDKTLFQHNLKGRTAENLTCTFKINVVSGQQYCGITSNQFTSNTAKCVPCKNYRDCSSGKAGDADENKICFPAGHSSCTMIGDNPVPCGDTRCPESANLVDAGVNQNLKDVDVTTTTAPKERLDNTPSTTNTPAGYCGAFHPTFASESGERCKPCDPHDWESTMCQDAGFPTGCWLAAAGTCADAVPCGDSRCPSN